MKKNNKEKKKNSEKKNSTLKSVLYILCPIIALAVTVLVVALTTMANFDYELSSEDGGYIISSYSGRKANLVIPEYAKAHLNGRHIDLVASGVTKSSGIRALMEAYGVKEEDVITVGDNYNDYDMIKRAGHGIVMGNHAPELEEVAEFIHDKFGNSIKYIADSGIFIAIVGHYIVF